MRYCNTTTRATAPRKHRRHKRRLSLTRATLEVYLFLDILFSERRGSLIPKAGGVLLLLKFEKKNRTTIGCHIIGLPFFWLFIRIVFFLNRAPSVKSSRKRWTHASLSWHVSLHCRWAHARLSWHVSLHRRWAHARLSWHVSLHRRWEHARLSWHVSLHRRSMDARKSIVARVGSSPMGARLSWHVSLSSSMGASYGRANSYTFLSGIVTGHDPNRQSHYQEVLKISRVEWGRIRRWLISHGTGRVG